MRPTDFWRTHLKEKRHRKGVYSQQQNSKFWKRATIESYKNIEAYIFCLHYETQRTQHLVKFWAKGCECSDDFNVSLNSKCYHPSPWQPRGHLTKYHARGTGLCPHKFSGDLTGPGKLQKFNMRGLFLPINTFSVSIQSMKHFLLLGLTLRIPGGRPDPPKVFPK